METYLYVIAASPEGPTKISHSVRPDRRVKQLQTGHAARLAVFYQQGVSSKDAQRIERSIHNTLGYLRVQGEWFDISVDDAISEVKFGLMSAP